MDTIKRHSTFPPLSFHFKNASGESIDCTLFEVRIVIKNNKNIIIANKIVGASASNAVWLDEENGIGEYQWRESDTVRVGRFKYEFKLTRLYDNEKFSLPKDDVFEYIVIDDIEGVEEALDDVS